MIKSHGKYPRKATYWRKSTARGGSNYPFKNPSSDIKYLLGDLFLSFDDMSDEVTFPLKVSWLYGFGTNPVSPPSGYPTPAHAYDIIITDAADEVVFDSTTGSMKGPDTWDNRLKIIEWQNSEGRILRVTTHTEWTQEDIDAGLDVTYDDYIEPVNGELQQDTWFKLPKRVKSITVGLNTYTAKPIILQEGNNVQINRGAEFEIPEIEIPEFNIGLTTNRLVTGERLSNKISLRSEPGVGTGRAPSLDPCGSSSRDIKIINGQRGNEHQNFFWDTEGCIRSQRTIGLVSETPRTFDYASTTLAATNAKSAIEVHNDCSNCCDCTYFAQTYQGLKRQWNLYKEVANSATATRDILHTNIDRWKVQKTIREKENLSIKCRQDGEGKVTWGVNFCNPLDCCLSQGYIYIVFIYRVNGVIQLPTVTPYDCNVTEIETSEQCLGPEDALLEQVGTSMLAWKLNWQYVDPGDMVTVTGRLCFPDAIGDLAETPTVSVQAYAVCGWENIASCMNSTDDEITTWKTARTLTLGDCLIPGYLSTIGMGWPGSGGPYAQKLSDQILGVGGGNPYCSNCHCTVPDSESESSS
mgnify:CR=1 FL=1